MSKKRKIKAELEAKLSVAEAESKRQKAAIGSAAKEYLCPISLALPVDPVIAEDGRAYNRAHIQKHIDTAQTKKKQLKSPMTNKPMGDKLIPAVQVQNSIRALIESGAVEDDMAKAWKEVDETKKRAEAGDARAMCLLSAYYSVGWEGLVKDLKKAYFWANKSAELKSTLGMAYKGFYLIEGMGVKQNVMEGSFLLGSAAGMGSPWASYKLGDYYYRGFCIGSGIINKNTGMAKYWTNKALADEVRRIEMTVTDIADAKKILKELEDSN